MSKKLMAGIIALLLLLALVFSLAFPFLLQAASSGAAGSGNLAVVSYSSSTPTVNSGEYLRLTVKFRDADLVGKNVENVIARVNTPSFEYYSTTYKEQLPAGTNTAALLNTGDFEMSFSTKYTGVGNTFTVDITYVDGSGNPVSGLVMQTVSLTLNNCIPASTAPPTNVIGTGFVLKSASYGNSEITAGTAFALSASFVATNGTNNVDNVNVTVRLPKELTLSSGSAVVYVGTVTPGQTFSVSFQILPSAIAEAGSYLISLDVAGINAGDGSSASATAEITVPVVQPERFEISNVMLPEYLFVGMNDGSGYSSISLVNKGKGTIYNVSAQIVGEGLSTEEGNQFIGNIAPGTQTSADFNLMATQPGQLNGTVVITYENAKGEEKQLTHDFTVTAEEGSYEDPWGPMDPVEPMPMPSPFPWWLPVLVVLLLAGGAVAVIIVLKKRKAQKAADLEADLNADLDEDLAEPADTVSPVFENDQVSPPQA